MDSYIVQLLSVGIMGVLVIGFVWLIGGVLHLVGSYRLAKNEGLDDIAWFVLIPVLQTYVLGKIPESSAPRSIRQYLGLANVIIFVLALITQIFWIVWLPLFMYTTFLTYKRYSKNYIAMMVVTVLTGFITYPFMIFAIRNNDVVVRDDRDEDADAFDIRVDDSTEHSNSRYVDPIDLNKK